MEQLQSHIWLTASSNIYAFPHILGSPSSYMTLQLLHSEFPYIWGKLNFVFHQCTVHTSVFIFCLVSQYNWIVPEDQELWEVPAERSDSFRESSETMDDLHKHTAHSQCILRFDLFKMLSGSLQGDPRYFSGNRGDIWMWRSSPRSKWQREGNESSLVKPLLLKMYSHPSWARSRRDYHCQVTLKVQLLGPFFIPDC